MSTDYTQLLSAFIDNPEDPEANFAMALYYHSIDQTASAVSFYLRTAERTQDTLLAYEAMIRASICFHTQGCRGNSVEGMLQHAVAMAPDRPEGYFHLSRYYEKGEKWHLGYLIACIGIGVANKKPDRKLRTRVDYPGFWSLHFEKAVCGWWCGVCEESKRTFEYLLFNEPLDLPHKISVIANLKKLGGWTEEADLQTLLRTKDDEVNNSLYELELYMTKHKQRLKRKFDGHDKISRNYSEAWQDMFVLTLMDGKTRGTYLEVGSGYPIYANNTYLLEREFGWIGVSIDNQSKFTQKHAIHRSHPAVTIDATSCDYADLLDRCGHQMHLDYLQVDCGDPQTSLAALEKVLSDGLTFKVITFSHYNYKDEGGQTKAAGRALMRRLGYRLLVSNVSHEDKDDYEDWFVDAAHFSPSILDSLRDDNDKIKNINTHFI